MKDLFSGGRGFALQLLWDAITPATKWTDPQNELVTANGPICGMTVYRRGWGRNGIPTVKKLRKLGMDLHKLIEVIEEANKKV